MKVRGHYEGRDRNRTKSLEIVGAPRLSKACFTSLYFYERPVFSNLKKSKEYFHSYEKKKWKFKVAVSVNHYRGSAHTQSGERGSTKLLLRELHSSSQHPTSIALNCVSQPLCFISIYFMHSLARCVLRELLLCFMLFQRM